MTSLSVTQQLLWATGVAIVLMVVLWLLQVATRKVALVDVGWAVLLGGSFIFYALTGDGDSSRRWLAGSMAALWSLRLGSHMLLNRVLSPHEDGRYVQWRKELGKKFQPVMLAFFLAQAVTIPVLAAPHLLNSHDPRGLGPLDFAATLLWLVGFAGVAMADRQLESFKKNMANKGKVCDVGLWRYSRHPNYFFEWLMWVAYALLATLAPSGWLAWTAPAVMLLLILKVSGIPPAEKQALRSKGEAYRRYQSRTSPFIPLPRRVVPGSGPEAKS